MSTMERFSELVLPEGELMRKADIVALKRAALERGKTGSDLERGSVQVYVNLK